MPTETLPIDEAPMLPPLVLRPPLGPRVLRVMVLALAVVFHLFTAGWNPLANGREGDIAGAARQLLLERGWIPDGMASPGGPLAVWLCKGSMHLFGIGEFGARLPAALGVLAMVWLAIRLGECFGGTWRGFVAGMLLLCTPGMFMLGRTLTAAPLAAAFVATVFLCLARGCAHRRGRRQWFFLAWLALGGAFLAGGALAAAIPLAALLLLALLHRKARLRLRALLSWEGALVLAALAAGAALWGMWGSGSVPPTGARRIVEWQAALLFPWSVLLVPVACSTAARLLSGRLEWDEAFALAWLVAGLAVIVLAPSGSLFDTLMVWPAFALWVARGLETLSRRGFLRCAAVVFAVGAGCLALTGHIRGGLLGLFPAIADFVRGIPDFFWPSIASVVFIAMLAFVLFAAVAFALDFSHHRRFAVIALFGAMLPAGYAFVDIAAKLSPYFSCAEIARCINASGVEQTRVVVDGARFGASSLLFYLDPDLLPFKPAPDPASPRAANAVWGKDKAGERQSVLVTRRTRLPLWERATGARRLQVACESGGSLLLESPPPGER